MSLLVSDSFHISNDDLSLLRLSLNNSINNSYNFNFNNNKFIILAQSCYSGKTRFLHYYGKSNPLIIIPCFQNNFLIHFRESIEEYRMKIQNHKTIYNNINFFTQQDNHNIIYLKIKCFLLSYLQIIYDYMVFYSINNLNNLNNIFYDKDLCTISLLDVLYYCFESHKLDINLINIYNEFCLLSNEKIQEKIEYLLKYLNYPSIALDDAHFLYLQGTGYLFHENYQDYIDDYKIDLLKSMEYEILNRSCLSHNILKYNYPMDILSGFIYIINNLQDNNYIKSLILSTSDLRIVKRYQSKNPFIYYKLPLYNINNISNICNNIFNTNIYINNTLLQNYTGKPGLLWNFIPNDLQESSINKSLNKCYEDLYIKLITSFKYFPMNDMNNNEYIEFIIAFIYQSIILEAKTLSHALLVPLLIRSGIGIWDGYNSVLLNEPIILLFIKHIALKYSINLYNIIQSLHKDILELEFSNNILFNENDSYQFNKIIIQSITSQLYHKYNHKSLSLLFSDWNLDKIVLKQYESYILHFNSAGTQEEYNIKSRIDYFSLNLQMLYESILEYNSPSEFPNIRCIGLENNDNICFIWICVKTLSRCVSSSEFLSTLNSLSIHKFIPRKISDRYKLLTNFINMVSSYKKIHHIRIFISSSGFSSLHIRSINNFNNIYPEQPILLLSINLLSKNIRENIYGSYIYSILEKHCKTNFFYIKSEKKTTTTIDLSDYIIPPHNNLLQSLEKKGGSLILSSKNQDKQYINTTKSQKQYYHQRKLQNPIHIPKEFIKSLD